MGRHYRTVLLWLLHLLAASYAESFPRTQHCPQPPSQPNDHERIRMERTGAVYASVSRTPGSGSLALVQHQLALGPAMALTPGQTLHLWHVPARDACTDRLCAALPALYGSGGQHLRNSPGASEWSYALPGQWQETVLVHQTLPDERYAARPHQSGDSLSRERPSPCR